jgi:hypothetical protein
VGGTDCVADDPTSAVSSGNNMTRIIRVAIWQPSVVSTAGAIRTSSASLSTNTETAKLQPPTSSSATIIVSLVSATLVVICPLETNNGSAISWIIALVPSIALIVCTKRSGFLCSARITNTNPEYRTLSAIANISVELSSVLNSRLIKPMVIAASKQTNISWFDATRFCALLRNIAIEKIVLSCDIIFFIVGIKSAVVIDLLSVHFFLVHLIYPQIRFHFCV